MKLYKYRNGKCNASGSEIKKLREASNLSQEQLAAKLQLNGLNISQKAISRIETGERIIPDYELLYFSKVFGVAINEILNDTLIDHLDI